MAKVDPTPPEGTWAFPTVGKPPNAMPASLLLIASALRTSGDYAGQVYVQVVGNGAILRSGAVEARVPTWTKDDAWAWVVHIGLTPVDKPPAHKRVRKPVQPVAGA